MTCKDCVHYKPCFYANIDNCEYFKDKSKFIELPCKVGDTVYFITGIYNTLIKPAKVEEIYIGDGVFALGVSTDFTTFTLQESEYYLSYEAAETALKEREQNG